MNDESLPCVIGRKPCGCVVFAQMTDSVDPRQMRNAATEIARAKRQGLTVESSTVGAVRQMTFGCKCKQKAKQGAMR